MVKNHIKRIKAPKTWNIHRKSKQRFVTKPYPGGQSLDLTLSVNTFLKDVLDISETTKETKYLLKRAHVKVNGKVCYDDKFPIGFLDVLSCEGKNYLCTINKRGVLDAKELKENTLLLRIKGKTLLKKNLVQLNSLNGLNVLVDAKESKNYKRGDSIVVSLEDKKIQSHFSRQKGAPVFVYQGRHVGVHGKIETIEKGVMKINHDDSFVETLSDRTVVIGNDKNTYDI